METLAFSEKWSTERWDTRKYGTDLRYREQELGLLRNGMAETAARYADLREASSPTREMRTDRFILMSAGVPAFTAALPESIRENVAAAADREPEKRPFDKFHSLCELVNLPEMFVPSRQDEQPADINRPWPTFQKKVRGKNNRKKTKRRKK